MNIIDEQCELKWQSEFWLKLPVFKCDLKMQIVPDRDFG
jgi:hypothetical protein